jgi:hypothetical protein
VNNERKDLDEVIATMQRIADRNGIELILAPRGYRHCECGGTYCGSYYSPRSLGKPYVKLAYDADRATPHGLFWNFGHEMGHAAQDRRGELSSSAYFFEADGRQRREVDAWNYSEALSNLSAWPPDQRFYRDRARALGTYGVIEDAAD